MYFIISLLLAGAFVAPVSAHLVVYEAVIVSFVNGQYEPNLVFRTGGTVVSEFENLGMLYAIIPAGAVEALGHNPAIAFIERDSEFSGEQLAVAASEYSESWALAEIGAEPVHSSDHTGAGIKIAILDTGVDYNHPELAPNYKGGYDFVNDDSDPMDDNGHGTHVAGIIAAARDGNGALGVAPDADIFALKVSDSKGKGSFNGLVEGISWAVENDIDIVTMSITGTGGSRALQKAVTTAYDEYGMILLAAVGNGASGNVLYPAAYPEVIGVGSVTADREKSYFSLTGSEVEIVAPGSGIKSTAIGGEYRIASGTSMATPFVTGAAALLLSTDELLWADSGWADGDGEWTNEEVRRILHETAIDLGEKGRDSLFGYGLLKIPVSQDMEGKDLLDQNDSTSQEVPRISVWLKFILPLN